MRRAVAFVSLSACATLASPGRGDVDLPSLMVGPFRPLARGEICVGEVCTGVNELPPGTPNAVVRAPFARAPSAIVIDGRVVLYASRGPSGGDRARDDRILRLSAEDARSFDDEATVLVADRPTEGGSLTDPAVLEVDGEIWLYVTIHPNGAAGQTPGIFRARSRDGRSFVKDDGLALGPGGGAWETTPPRAPSVVRDGVRFRMFYAAGDAIGEAVSDDGARFVRIEGAPVLGPSAPVDVGSLPQGVRAPFDDRAVDDPSVVRIETAAGRILFAMHYTGRDRRGGSSIGYAGRFGDAGPFTRNEGFVFGGRLRGDPDDSSHANAPTLARFADFALLYADIDQDRGQRIGIGISPQTRTLPWP
jgi:hypothetical protein